MRTLNENVRTRSHELMRQTLASVTSAYDAKFELSFDDSNPVTYNDPQLVDQTLPTIRRIVGDTNVLALKPFMPAEDFSYYQKVIPGFFYFLGVGNKSKGLMPAWHTAEFDVDEESLIVGVKVMSNVLLDYLDRHGAQR
jgi:metal-dependent amidase/aminoacylase/carboxypeptidase family protein